MGVISRDYASSGLHPALGFQPKHPGKSLALLPNRSPQPHGPLASRTNLNDDHDYQHGHQAHWGFIGNQLTLVELHLHHNCTPPTDCYAVTSASEWRLVVSGEGVHTQSLPCSLGSEPVLLRHTPHSWLSDTSDEVIYTRDAQRLKYQKQKVTPLSNKSTKGLQQPEELNNGGGVRWELGNLSVMFSLCIGNV